MEVKRLSQKTVQVNKRGNPVFELVPGMELPSIPEPIKKTLCPNCGSLDIDETPTEIHCHRCGLGKYKRGRR